jgi:NADH:ubiquinone oxidoreductase subunit F (NADH-binding)/(2Fe-2S) ferredoxin/NAD-dependent dihydropyrimidine dehydrogenase PreA subunit
MIMPKLTSLQDLRTLRAELHPEVVQRYEVGTTLVVAMGTCGIKAGARETLRALSSELAQRDVRVHLTTGGCIDRCAHEPLVAVYQAGGSPTLYGNVTADKVADLVERHLVQGHVIQEWVVPPDGKERPATRRPRATVLLCSGTGCLASGSNPVYEALSAELERHALQDEIQVVTGGCRGFCSMGPVMDVYPGGLFYVQVRPSDIPQIVEQTLIDGQIVEDLCYKDPATQEIIPIYSDIPFYATQERIVLRNCGRINPNRIEEYIAVGGYDALAHALLAMSPEQIIADVKASGLRGRGGAGFSTGRKWEAAYAAEGDVKYVVVNGDEGDPGAFMDRSTMEADPHSVLEGLIIGAYVIDAREGYFYVRDEYPLALNNLQIAIDQAREYGLLGENILGSGFDFDVQIMRGAGAFVCGESSALMQSLEGKVGEPRPKHIHATERGLWDRPTVLNNVKTWATIPHIVNNGPEWFTRMGTEGSPGTMVFSLVGKVNNTGLVEVPMGISLRDMVYDIGGGVLDGKQFKAVQTGGPSGGCIPAELLDLPVDFDRLTEAGSMMGSGGMVVMDEDTCMVDVARYFLDFLKGESCGKCVACREGIKHMLEILTTIAEGRGTMVDVEQLGTLAWMVQQGSLCQLGKSAPNPVLSTLRYFRDEYVAHVEQKRCPGGVCRALITYSIDPEKCTGCMVCARSCPQDAISGERKQVHTIDPELCICCGVCRDLCRFDAVVVQ